MALIAYKAQGQHQGILHIGDDLLLMPGINKVDDKAWAEAMKIALVKDYFVKKEILKELGPASKDKKSDKLSDREEADALDLIRDCNNVATLEAWNLDEKRPLVRDALAKRLELLQTPDQKADQAAK